jgi:hypothetical protein
MADTTTGGADELASARPGSPARFSWSATIVSAVIAVVVTIVLLLLGSGLGLALAPNSAGPQGVAPAFITLGAIYFLAAQAFGMAVGGHAVGRMIGPQIETPNEENFRAAAHGLAVWAFAVLITLGLLVATGSIAEKSAIRLSSLYGGTTVAAQGKETSIDYLVDLLFRPQGQDNRHASLDGVRFAQASTQPATDAAPAAPANNPVSNGPPPQQPPGSSEIEVPGGQSNFPAPFEQPQTPGGETGPRATRHVPGDLAPAAPPANAPNPAQLAADKAEAMHVLEAASIDGAAVSVDDRDRIAQLVAQDVNMSYEAATARANDILAKLHDTRAASFNAARKMAGFSALWLAASFIFGAIVSVVAAVSARWEDDLQTMFAVVRPRKR